MSVNPPVIATDKGKRLRRGMTPLPRALLIPAHGRPGLAGSRGDIALVDAASPLHALRKLLAGGTRTVALSACRTGADLQRMATLLAVLSAYGFPTLAMLMLAISNNDFDAMLGRATLDQQ